METEKLREILSKLNELPVLEERLKKLKSLIHEADNTARELKSRYEDEALDVQKLLNESFSAKLLQFIGRYEGKLTKERQEELSAKQEYDRSCTRVEQLNLQCGELLSRISSLKNDQAMYRNELERRRKEILQNHSGERFMNYKKMEDQISELARQNIEIDEAIKAADKTIAIAEGAWDNLRSAEGWATFDVWTKGGIISHMAKYENVDAAEEAFGMLEDQLKDLQKELADVDSQVASELVHIDGATRAIDFWFDNIFTDLNVRSMIQENIEKLNDLCTRINTAKSNLEHKKVNNHIEMDKLEKEKDELLIES